MEWVKRSWMQIHVWMEGLTRAERWLIICLLIIGVAAVGGMVFMAKKAEMVSIPVAASQVENALSQLKRRGISASIDAGKIEVLASQEFDAMAVLVQSDLLAEDSSAAFDKLIEKQSPWLTARQGDRNFLLAKQQVLASVISKMRGVRSANVFLGEPTKIGFAVTHREPTASVMVHMEGGQSVKPLVKGIASLVSGAVAELKPQHVEIIDAQTGKRHTVNDGNGPDPTEIMEIVRQREDYYRQKIEGALSHIHNVVVAVNVISDNIRNETVQKHEYDSRQLILTERDTSRTSRSIQKSGPAGVRPNTRMDIGDNGAGGSEETFSETETTSGERPLLSTSHTTLIGQQIKKISATVSVPRVYFVQLFKAANPESESNPTDADLQGIIDKELSDVKAQVKLVIAAAEEGEVFARMIPDATVLTAQLGNAMTSSGIASVMQSQWMGPAGIVLLAGISIALMLFMVRKAVQPEALPSVEELAGVPPTLPTEDDLVGEVEEHEASMEGVELDETELKSRRIAEQISDMVKSNPSEAGGLLNRWVRVDE